MNFTEEEQFILAATSCSVIRQKRRGVIEDYKNISAQLFEFIKLYGNAFVFANY